MRGKNGICKVTSRQINRVKERLGKDTLREISRAMGLSFTTVWHIKNGKYDTNEPLQPKVKKSRAKMFNMDEHQDWVVGGIIEKRAV